MTDDIVQEYHFERQRQCLAMAAAASDPCARQLHERLAVEHHKLAAGEDPPNQVGGSERASATDKLENQDNDRDHE